jgi:hypothetical protein
MITFTDWCDASPSLVGTHGMRILIARQNGLPYGRDAVAAAVPAHYASGDHVARILENDEGQAVFDVERFRHRVLASAEPEGRA